MSTPVNSEDQPSFLRERPTSEETAGENFATGIVNAYDGGLTFFGFTDNHRLRLIKTDSYGFFFNE